MAAATTPMAGTLNQENVQEECTIYLLLACVSALVAEYVIWHQLREESSLSPAVLCCPSPAEIQLKVNYQPFLQIRNRIYVLIIWQLYYILISEIQSAENDSADICLNTTFKTSTSQHALKSFTSCCAHLRWSFHQSLSAKRRMCIICCICTYVYFFASIFILTQPKYKCSFVYSMLMYEAVT